MPDIRRLGQLIIARIAAEVPELGGRVSDWNTESIGFPNVTIDTAYGVEADAACIEADEWVIQVSVWDINSNTLKHAQLGDKVRQALKGWSDTAEVTMAPLRVPPPVVTRDPDGLTMRARLMIEASVEA